MSLAPRALFLILPLSLPLPAAVPPVAAQEVAATRAERSPHIDGRDDDEVWARAERVTAFRTFQPREDEAPEFRTEMRVAYDDRALYIFVRNHDPRPDSIVRLLSRRDSDGAPNDQVQLFIDSWYDRRSGYEYIVNAAGVQSDYLLFDDTGFDQSWDGVWSAATQVDSLGWTVEFAIPLQQLGYRQQEAPTFGIMLWRLVGRRGERASWPLFRASRSGYVSQTGTLTGVRGLPRTMGAQAVPYVLTRARDASAVTPGDPRRTTDLALGADLRVHPTAGMTIDATLNPDFGQVESDPAVLDLSGFEVFQAERRPFFKQGAGPFSMPLANDGSALLFHSRRIGRAPALAARPDASGAPTETSILGAAMLTARPSASSSIVALSAMTDQETARGIAGVRPVVEPRATYGAARAQQEFRGGRSGVGLMATHVDRGAGDAMSDAALPRVAQAATLTTQHQSGNGDYRVSGWLAASEVRGSTEAMSQLQLSTVHGFQRPDDDVAFDATMTSMNGSAGQVFAGKVAGGVTRYDASYRWIAPGFDVNEMGFLTKAGVRNATATAAVRANQPGSLLGVQYRSGTAGVSFAGEWATDGLPLSRQLALSGSMQFMGFVSLRGAVARELDGGFCALTCTRGGPALADEPRAEATAGVTGDSRRRFIPSLDVSWSEDDGGRSRSAGATIGATWRARTNLDLSLAAEVSDRMHDAFFYRRFGSPLSDTTHYTFARLRQPVRSLTTRINHTLTTALSLQWYAQVYLSRGTFADVRELADPRARRYEDRFMPYGDIAVTADPGGVDLRQFRSNAVLRWEYQPGSAVFLVWTQGRDRGTSDGEALRVGPDLDDLFAARPVNVIALKVSYWLSR
jgi:hypothetical protein